jgi:hypothetical protein
LAVGLDLDDKILNTEFVFLIESHPFVKEVDGSELTATHSGANRAHVGAITAPCWSRARVSYGGFPGQNGVVA